MTGHVLDRQPEYLFNEASVSQKVEEFVPDNIDLMKDINDQIISTLLYEGNAELLVGQTKDIVRPYLTKSEAIQFFNSFCDLAQVYKQQGRKLFQKDYKYQIVTCVLCCLSQDKHNYGNQYRKYTNLKRSLMNILKVVKPRVYNSSVVL
jgi:hypothetical protein